MSNPDLKKRSIATALSVAIIILTLFCLDRIYPMQTGLKNRAVLVTARDGTPLRAFADEKGVWQYPVRLGQVSKLYLQTLLAYEDRWFYYHPGINPLAAIRALFQNLKAGRIISGGSTLTMQTARLLYRRPGMPTRTLSAKFLQCLRALQLEWHLTKNEILSLYINLAPFGANIKGVRTASVSWFGKQADELSHAQAALLAVLPQAPSRFRPDRHPKRAKNARDKVLNRMRIFKIWPKEVVTAAIQEPLTTQRFVPPINAPLLSRRLKNKYPGLPLIETTIDYDLQVHIHTLVRDYVSQLSPEQSTGVLVVNHKTLQTIAYIGSADFLSQKRKGHVDMVQAVRSPGSTLKPFLYGLAMDKGLIHSHSMLLDIPRFQKTYDPGNFSKGFSGPVTVTKALRLSLNIPAVQVLEVYGPQVFHDNLVHAGADITLSGPPNLSMILGGLGTNLESLVTLYTGLARKGISGRPIRVKGQKKQERYLMSEGAAWIIRDILAQPMPGFEDINRLAGYTPMAWKTGTSYGFRDAWAIGIMGDFVAGVWVGRPDGSPSIGQYGAVTALPLLRQVLESLPLSDFTTPPPETVTRQSICWPLGLPEDQTRNACHVRFQAWILNHQTPLTLNRHNNEFIPLMKTFWIDSDGKRATPSCSGIQKISMVTWPAGVQRFIPVSWRTSRQVPPPSDKCPDLAELTAQPLQITSIFNHSILSRPTGSSSNVSLPLETQGGQGPTYWFLNREPVAELAPGTAGSLTIPQPGSYQLSAVDAQGNFDMVDFTVANEK